MNTHTLRSSARGSALITVLIFISIVSVLLAGIAKFSISHQQLALNDSRYAAALSLAEAGANTEFRKISLDASLPDQWPGATANWGGGSYTVWCANSDGSVPWNNAWPNNSDLLVFSRGTVDGVTRTVKVKVKGYNASGNYAIYGTNQVSTFNGTAVTIRGDIGTNDELQFTGSPNIQGSVYFNGPGAGWVGGTPSGYNEVHDTKVIQWPTVSEVAMQQFPAGGLPWLATHNSNSLANPPIIGNTITTNVTLPAGNYYLTNVSLTAGRKITFNNTGGPVNVWIGPEGSPAVANWRGGSAAISVTSDPTKTPRIYAATKGGIDLGGGEVMDALVYAVNRDGAGNTYGHIDNSGNPTINGQLIADNIDLNGNISVNFVKDLIRPVTFGYYGYDNLWEEGRVNGPGTWTPGGR